MVAVLASAGVVTVAAPVAVWLDPAARDAFWWAALVTVGVWGLVVLLAVPTRYELTPSELRVRSGVLRTSLAWAELECVELVSSPVASTTAPWTARRVALVTREGRVLEVGPRDRLGFVDEVLARAPWLLEEPSVGPRRVWRGVGGPRSRG